MANNKMFSVIPVIFALMIAACGGDKGNNQVTQLLSDTPQENQQKNDVSNSLVLPTVSANDAQPTNLGIARIVGGVNAGADEFPFMVKVLIRTANSRPFVCGGTLLNSNFVLTAAHCVINVRTARAVDPTMVKVTYGINDFYDAGIEFSVESVIAHEGYNPRTYINDIALLRLTNNSQQLETISIGGTTQVGGQVTAIGWGVRRQGAQLPTRNPLQRVELNIFNDQACEKAYGSYYFDWDNFNWDTFDFNTDVVFKTNYSAATQLCVGSRERKDTCQGDSGGPILVSNGSGYQQMGVTSYGAACASGTPAVYTDVRAYTRWISSRQGR